MSVKSHILRESTDFYNYANLEQRPIVGDLKLIETFNLDADKKLSHKFLVSNNTVETTDSRTNLFEIEKDYNYLSFVLEELISS